MARESKLQKDIAGFLRELGYWVMVIQPQVGIPTGTSDIFFCKGAFYGFIEVKASKNSPFRPLQLEFVEKMEQWSWARVVYPENWPEIKKELSSHCH